MNYNQPWNRPDLDEFVQGHLYRHSETDELVEFIGIAGCGGTNGEDVAIFRMVPNGGCLIANKESHTQGETFQPAADALADDLAIGGADDA